MAPIGKSWLLPAAAVMICIAPATFVESKLLRGGRRELAQSFKPEGAVACLTQRQCNARRTKQGYSNAVYYVGDYETKGCFSKNGRAYFGTGGTVEAMAKEDLAGVRTRIWCGLLDTEQPTDQPSISPPATITPVSSEPTPSPIPGETTSETAADDSNDTSQAEAPSPLSTEAPPGTVANLIAPVAPTMFPSSEVIVTIEPSDGPTKSPTTIEPSRAPVTSEPSDSPTKSPVTNEPSAELSGSPTKYPTSDTPSKSPTTSQPSIARSETLPETSLEPSEAPVISTTAESTTVPDLEESFDSETSSPVAESESPDGSTDLQPFDLALFTDLFTDEVDTNELSEIIANHLLVVFQDEIPDSSIAGVSVTVEDSTLARSLQDAFALKDKKFAYQVMGEVSYSGTEAPTLESISSATKASFDGQAGDAFLVSLQNAEDPGLRSTKSYEVDLTEEVDYDQVPAVPVVPVESLLPVEEAKLIENNVLYIVIGIFSVCFVLIGLHVLKTRRGRRQQERAESRRAEIEDDDRSGEVTLPRYIEVDSETKRQRAMGSAMAQCDDIAPDCAMCSVTDTIKKSDSGNSSTSSSVGRMSRTSTVSDKSSKSGQSSKSEGLSLFKRFNQQDLNTISETSGANETFAVVEEDDHCINLCGYQDTGVSTSRETSWNTMTRQSSIQQQSTSSASIKTEKASVNR